MLHTIDSYDSEHIAGMGHTQSQGTGSGTIVFPTDGGFTDPLDVSEALITPDQPLLLSEGALEKFNIFRDSIRRTLFTSSSITGPQDNIVHVGKPAFYEGIPRLLFPVPVLFTRADGVPFNWDHSPLAESYRQFLSRPVDRTPPKSWVDSVVVDPARADVA